MNLFELAAKITLDSSEYDKGIKDATDKGKGLSGGMGKLGGAFKAFGKVAVASVGAAATGIGTLVTASTKAYADYEQLVGGLTTLFEDLSYDIEENANRAFETAGMSANEYMETVMNFGAALNSSLIASEGNISRSADLADQIVRDMSDNANKMGTDMQMIQNAYQGFSKQNYTMLDNLKLGRPNIAQYKPCENGETLYKVA